MMSGQHAKAAEFLRKAAEALESSEPRASCTATQDSNPNPSISTTVMNLFAPYRGRAQVSKRRQTKLTPVSYWTHRFCLLASSN